MRSICRAWDGSEFRAGHRRANGQTTPDVERSGAGRTVRRQVVTVTTGDIFAAAPPVCQRPSQRLTKKEQKRKTKDPFSRKRTVEGKLRQAVV